LGKGRGVVLGIGVGDAVALGLEGVEVVGHILGEDARDDGNGGEAGDTELGEDVFGRGGGVGYAGDGDEGEGEGFADDGATDLGAVLAADWVGVEGDGDPGDVAREAGEEGGGGPSADLFEVDVEGGGVVGGVGRAADDGALGERGEGGVEVLSGEGGLGGGEGGDGLGGSLELGAEGLDELFGFGELGGEVGAVLFDRVEFGGEEPDLGKLGSGRGRRGFGVGEGFAGLEFADCVGVSREEGFGGGLGHGTLLERM
jgi:hypothetical protein